ncbi:MAG: hypothetical protein L6420_01460 [Elusimicrobia bacterium]|nr:hypothetical protein [Elusimicrobiota bacterium]
MNFFKSSIFLLAFLSLFSFSNLCFGESVSILQNSSIPKPSLKHLQELTDDTGIFEFAAYDIPDKKHAYCTEDNARALVAVLMFNRKYPSDKTAEKLAKIYMSYLLYAQQEDGNFSHRLDFQRRSHDIATEDSYGRSIWGIGYASAHPINESMRSLAKKMFKKALWRAKKLQAPRAETYTILGLHHYLKAYPNSPDVRKILIKLADSLVNCYKKNSTKDWQWFEKTATYDNAKLPLALFLAYEHTKNKEYFDIAEKTLGFLIKANFRGEKMMQVIGNNGWYSKGKKPAVYDQQPIDAAAMVEACAKAYLITDLKEYKDKMILAFEWFLGNNAAGKPIYDFTNGGSKDGIAKTGINENEGAESSIEVLISLLTLKETLQQGN